MELPRHHASDLSKQTLKIQIYDPTRSVNPSTERSHTRTGHQCQQVQDGSVNIQTQASQTTEARQGGPTLLFIRLQRASTDPSQSSICSKDANICRIGVGVWLRLDCHMCSLSLGMLRFSPLVLCRGSSRTRSLDERPTLRLKFE